MIVGLVNCSVGIVFEIKLGYNHAIVEEHTVHELIKALDYFDRPLNLFYVV